MFCSMTHFKHQSTFSPHFPSCTITFKALSILQFEPPRNMAYTAHFAVLFKWSHHYSGRTNEWILFTKDALDRPIVTWSLLETFFFCAESHLWWKPVNFLILQKLKQIGVKFQICQSFAAICKCQVFFRRVTRTKKIAWSDGHGSWRATSDDTCANYSQHVLGAWFFPAVFCLEPSTCLFHQQSWNISKGMKLIFTCKLMYSHHKYIYI